MNTPMIYEIRKNKISRLISFLLILCIIFQFNGCYYYKAIIPVETPPKVIENNAYGSYIMMHKGDEVATLDNIVVFDDRITCTMGEVVGHDYYKIATTNVPHRYKTREKQDESEVLNEVHLFVSGYDQVNGNDIVINNTQMIKVELYNTANAATALSFGLGTTGAAIAGFYTLLGIVVLIASCPFVYTNDGGEFVYSGEIYAGAIKSGIERDDYLILSNLQAEDGNYKIIVANMIKEIQHTNHLELIYVDHSAQTEIMADKYGEIYAINEILEPESVKNLRGDDLSEVLSEKDNDYYFGPEFDSEPDLLDGIVLEYDLPSDKQTVNLVLKAKNSFWLEYVFNKFHELLGDGYDEYVKSKSKQTKEELINDMIQQHIPVSVYIEKNGEWEFQDYYNLIGPVSMKDDILKLDITDLNEESLRVKLEYGSYFWELDYIGLDISSQTDLDFTVAPMISALDENGKDVSGLIAKDDDMYYTQPRIGNQAEIEFTAPEQQMQRTLILHSKGYYEIIRDHQGKKDVAALRSLKKGDGLVRLSSELIREKMEKKSQLVTQE